MATGNSGTLAPIADRSKFGQGKPAQFVVFKLIHRNKKIRPDTPEYPPYVRIPNEDTIIYKDQNRGIRLLPKEPSIFVDDQEKNGRQIPPNVLNNPNNRIEIISGEIRVKVSEVQKIQFLRMTNYNRDSPHSTGMRVPKFFEYSGSLSDDERLGNEKLVAAMTNIAVNLKIDEARKMVHAFDILLYDPVTNEGRTDNAIFADLIQIAKDDPRRWQAVYEKHVGPIGGKLEA